MYTNFNLGTVNASGSVVNTGRFQTNILVIFGKYFFLIAYSNVLVFVFAFILVFVEDRLCRLPVAQAAGYYVTRLGAWQQQDFSNKLLQARKYTNTLHINFYMFSSVLI